MKRIAIICTLIICAWQTNASGINEQWWQQGNNYYQQKEYDSAIASYEHVSILNPKDAIVYYNLGNAYYRLNKIGYAVLNYERALRYDPSFKEAMENLLLTQTRIANRIPHVPDIFFVKWWKLITKGTNANGWAIAALLFFLCALAIVLFRRTGKRNISIPSQLTGIMILLCIGCLSLAYVASGNKIESQIAVVMQNEAPLLLQVQGKTQSLVPEGTIVEIKETTGSWTHIQLPDGRTGWIQNNFLTQV
ncbi:MAG: tetratricopeptide repeat protein [Taibaiella sp.]|nr:tetratricopeptide repeat protein [Taibaiella sp.]